MTYRVASARTLALGRSSGFAWLEPGGFVARGLDYDVTMVIGIDGAVRTVATPTAPGSSGSPHSA
ncbi:MAG: hypothetical protein ACR2KV_05730 [Solirubrobacteraceae bacterium]